MLKLIKRIKHRKVAKVAMGTRLIYLKLYGEREKVHRVIAAERTMRKTIFYCGHCGARAVGFIFQKGDKLWYCANCEESSCSWAAVCAPYAEAV